MCRLSVYYNKHDATSSQYTRVWACVRELIYYYQVPQERPEAQSNYVMTGSGCAVRVVLVLVYCNVLQYHNIIIWVLGRVLNNNIKYRKKMRRRSSNYHTAILSDDVITVHIVSFILLGFRTI